MPVAQLDRVFGYEPKGRGFESLQARFNKIKGFVVFSKLFFIVKNAVCVTFVQSFIILDSQNKSSNIVAMT